MKIILENIYRILCNYLLEFIKKYPIQFYGLIITCILSSLTESLFPYAFKVMIDALTDQQVFGLDSIIPSKLWASLLAIVNTWVCIIILNRVQDIIIYKTLPRYRAEIREKIFKYVSSHAHSYFVKHFTGSIINKMFTIPRSIEYIITDILINSLRICLTLSFSVMILYQAHPVFSYISILWILLHMAILLITTKKCDKLFLNHAEETNALYGKTLDVFFNIFIVRLFVSRKLEIQKFKKRQAAELQKTFRAFFYLEKVKIMQATINCMGFIFTLFSLIIQWKNKFITIGDFSLVFMSIINILGRINFFGTQVSGFFSELGRLQSNITIVRDPHELKDQNGAKDFVPKNGHIQLKNVSFYHDKNRFLIKNQSICIYPGETVIVLGPSGSGKTTLINLLLRVSNPVDGQILIDHQDIAMLTQESLRRQFSVLPQENFLFNASIFENIAYNNESVSMKSIKKASKMASCHDFITKLPFQYNTIVGEGGSKLSGGEKRRICLARTFLKNSLINIFDEPTAGLDLENEYYICRSLKVFSQQKTTLIFTHSKRLLSLADRVIYIAAGRFKERTNRS